MLWFVQLATIDGARWPAGQLLHLPSSFQKEVTTAWCAPNGLLAAAVLPALTQQDLVRVWQGDVCTDLCKALSWPHVAPEAPSQQAGPCTEPCGVKAELLRVKLRLYCC